MPNTPIRIGFCTDLNGPYQSVDGPAGAEAIRMAIEDMGGSVVGRKIELLLGDHHNNQLEAAAIARRWYSEEGVDVVIGGVNSDTSLALASVATQQGKPILIVGAGTSIQTRERAAFPVIQYAYNTLALATVPGLVLTRRGMKDWFYITADYPFGRELQEHGIAAVEMAGGRLVGSVINAHGEEDFTSFLRTARDSGAQVLALANGHAGLIKAMDAMTSMDMTGRMALVGLLTFIDDIREISLEKAQGLYLADSWFWTRDAEARKWAHRFHSRQQRMPSSLQVADYSAATQFLKAVASVGSTDPGAVLQHLRAGVLNDVYVQNGRVRDDGTMIHDMHLLRVKSPQQSAEEWDYYDLIATIPGYEAFPIGEQTISARSLKSRD